MKNIFIIGSKGIPSKYGGFETFVEKLTEKRESKVIKYHVACMSDNENEFEHNNARCFNINVPNIGSAKAVIYDIKALKACLSYIEKNSIKDAIIYILACRIGPFIGYYKKKLKKLGIKLYVNPDGHEWKRNKWNFAIKKYWKNSEKYMIKNADLVICDSLSIEKYIINDYKNYLPKTIYISYGADIDNFNIDSKKSEEWYKCKEIEKNGYYLMVGRFVPENNYETVIKEFMISKTKKDLVIVTNYEGSKFYDELKKTVKFDNDRRIKFVGTVYDQSLLYEIRKDAYAYIHGHEVGGTNPSLLEALATTKLNVLLDVGFNKEVGRDSSMYFNKERRNLASLIDNLDKMNESEKSSLEIKAKKIIKDSYSWNKIIDEYEKLFITGGKLFESTNASQK